MNTVLTILSKRKDQRSEQDINILLLYAGNMDLKPPNENNENVYDKMKPEDLKYICEQMTLQVYKAG